MDLIEKKGLEKVGVYDRILPKVYSGLAKRLTSNNMKFFGSIRIQERGGFVEVVAPNEFYLGRLKKNYSTVICDSVSDAGFDSNNVIWSVNEGLSSTQKQRTLFDEINYSCSSGEAILNACSPYSYLEGFKGKEILNPIIYKGNEEVYSKLKALLKKDEFGSLILHGKNGLGKTYAINWFLQNEFIKKRPSVSFNIDNFSSFLRGEGSSDYADRSRLASSVARNLIFDQFHNIARVGTEGFYHRTGVQNNILDYVEKVRERGGKVIFNFTEKDGFSLGDLIESMVDESVDVYGKKGNKDLGDRLSNFDDVRIGDISSSDLESVFCEVVGRNPILMRDGSSKKEIVNAFLDASYRTKPNMRKVIGDVSKVISGATHSNSKITPFYIINRVGSKWARNKLSGGSEEESSWFYEFGASVKSCSKALVAFRFNQIGVKLSGDIKALQEIHEKFLSGENSEKMIKVINDIPNGKRALKNLVNRWKNSGDLF